MKLKIFISWSGTASKFVAQSLRAWLPEVVHNCQPWISEDDIAKGSRGMEEIEYAIRDADAGIACVTSDNFESTWLHYEVGALSHSVGSSSLVSPVLLGLEPSDLRAPLGNLQVTSPTKEDIYRLASDLNELLAPDYRASDSALLMRFERDWNTLEDSLKHAESLLNSTIISRPTNDVVNEILNIVRSMNRSRDRDYEPANFMTQFTDACRASLRRKLSEISDPIERAKGLEAVIKAGDCIEFAQIGKVTVRDIENVRGVTQILIESKTGETGWITSAGGYFHFNAYQFVDQLQSPQHLT